MQRLVPVLLSLLLALGMQTRSAHASQISVNAADWTFTLSQSVPGFSAWTTPTAHRVHSTETTAPSAQGGAIPVHCAMEEFESFQVIIAPSGVGSATVSLGAFSNLGPTASVDIGLGQWTAVPSAMGGYSVIESTTLVAQGGSFQVSSSRPTVLWITLYVPAAGTTPGSTQATLTLTPSGSSAVQIPVALYVFNFVLDKTSHFDTMMMTQPNPDTTQWPSSWTSQQMVTALNNWKQVPFQHRLTSTYPAWPDGLNDGVAWDCSNHQIITGAGNTNCIWANQCLEQIYMLGMNITNWRSQGDNYPAPSWLAGSQGFSSQMLENTSGGRPSKFCGQSCSSTTTANGCGSAYESEWNKYIAALGNYVNSAACNIGYKSFWYTVNEPQGPSDYNWAAYLCGLRNANAPNLRIAVTEEAKQEIAERPDYNCNGYDIWIGEMTAYHRAYTWNRMRDHGETSWFYSLDDDMNCGSHCPGNTLINPTPYATGLNDGMHYRALTYVAFSERITGWLYYHDVSFWDVPNNSAMRPRVSAALLREAMEDYEYLFQANGRKQPKAWTNEPADDTARSIGYCPSSWSSDYVAFAELRKQLGRKVEGTRGDFPYLYALSPRPFGTYYLDFGASSTQTLNGNTYLPVRMNPFDVSAGIGFCGSNLGPNSNAVSYNSVSGGNAVTNTFMYDAYAGRNEFYFALTNGVYNVTVGIGDPSKCTSYQEYVQVMGFTLRNSSGSPCDQGVRAYSTQATVSDGVLALAFGCIGGECHYSDTALTLLNFMIVQGLSQGPAPPPPPPQQAPVSPSQSTSSPSPSPSPSPSGDAACARVASGAILFAVLFFALLI